MNFLFKELKMVGIVHPFLMFPGLHQLDGAHYPGILLTELYRSFFFISQSAWSALASLKMRVICSTCTV